MELINISSVLEMELININTMMVMKCMNISRRVFGIMSTVHG